MKKAAIYARVSTDKQEERRTIESQLAELREVCRKSEVEVVQEYTDDGVSGTTLARPGLDRLRDDASKVLFQAVYILSPDRLARKYVYQALVIEELRKEGIEVTFLDKPVTDKPEDQLLLGIQGLISEYERAQILERTRRGRLHKARNGEFVTNNPPYGYQYVKKSRDSLPHLGINEPEAEVVRLIFSLYLGQGKSITGVARELIHRRIKTRKTLRHWRANVVWRILKNPSYVGQTFYNKTAGRGQVTMRDRSEWIPVKIPAIVDAETFRLVQEILKSRRQTQRSGLRVYLLSGLMKCKYCGSRYSGGSSIRGHRYYRCTNFTKTRPFPKTCLAKSIRAERVEQGVVEAIKGAVTNSEVLKAYLLDMTRRLAEQAGGVGIEARRLSQQLQTLEQRQRKLVDLYLEGMIGKEEYLERKSGIEDALKELETKEAEMARQMPLVDEAMVTQSLEWFAREARQRLENITSETLRVFLRCLLEEVVVDWKKMEVRIVGHIPGGSRGQILPEIPCIQTPEISGKNQLRFELNVPIPIYEVS